MKKEPTIVIGTINFNSEDMTINCLKELEKISYKNKKIWVLDNGSARESLKRVELAKSNFKFSLIKLKKNLGYAGGANRLIDAILKKGRPDYILLINNDMLFPDRNFLNKMAQKMENDKSIGIANPIVLTRDNRIQNGGAYLDDYLKYAKRIYVDVPLKDGPKKDYFVDSYGGCAWLVRSEIFTKEKMRFKDKYFVYCEDEEFCIRLRKKGYKILVDTSSNVIHLEGVSANKVGSGFAVYYITRNEFWMRKEHATRKQMVIFLFFYFFIFFPKRFIYLIIVKKDINALLSYFKGLRDGLFKNY
ncbi:MAG: glycosyltransferase family 2 protein [archaeon]